jgi:hypothetical protein
LSNQLFSWNISTPGGHESSAPPLEMPNSLASAIRRRKRAEEPAMKDNRIFISYHRSDGDADAGRLGDELRRRFGKEQVFTDVDDIEFGTNWRRVVDHTLQDAVALLLIIGPVWKLTEPIEYEIGIALDIGVATIPVLVRGAKWETVMGDLPHKLEPLAKLNAAFLDHGSWQRDIEPLLSLLERMMKDFARAKVILNPPEPVSLLQNAMNKKSIRSLVVHAADLAECLSDPTVLAEAQQAASENSAASREVPFTLFNHVINARYRLMVEQIGSDLLKTSRDEAAQYLGDVELAELIRTSWKEFEEERDLCSSTRGDAGSPNEYYHLAREITGRAYDRLRAQLPGLTKSAETRNRLFKFVENKANEALARKEINDWLEYAILKNFYFYREMPIIIRDVGLAGEMLRRFEKSKKSSYS